MPDDATVYQSYKNAHLAQVVSENPSHYHIASSASAANKPNIEGAIGVGKDNAIPLSTYDIHYGGAVDVESIDKKSGAPTTEKRGAEGLVTNAYVEDDKTSKFYGRPVLVFNAKYKAPKIETKSRLKAGAKTASAENYEEYKDVTGEETVENPQVVPLTEDVINKLGKSYKVDALRKWFNEVTKPAQKNKSTTTDIKGF